MSFVRVCALSDLTENAPKAVEVDGVPVCLARVDGEVLALLDECSHAEVALSDGDVDGGTVECWLHGSRFDLRTGKPIGPPATEAVPTYPVRVDGDDVLVAVKE
ncbi:MAG TPA: non-heme iron oxygenase ferredoxin subunit [Mycobacteriales bacterium]|jgi:3-phenylpropionate/trans-cinnamate dioxygenase ferredoxin subunit|nr:non-heme iron oxygenase ferredoxin subunit [Mycobacteriales bacterium]